MTVRTARPGDTDRVADLVADAFLHLDAIRFLVPDDARRRPVSREWYRLHIAHAAGGAGEVVVTGDGNAAAVWFDRTVTHTPPDTYERQLADLAGDDLPRFTELEDEMDALHPNDPHWHLLFLAVRPGHWNRGLGSALLRHTHARLDMDGVPAYLEATGNDNKRLYARHGYRDMRPQRIVLSDGTPLHRMWRAPLA